MADQFLHERAFELMAEGQRLTVEISRVSIYGGGGALALLVTLGGSEEWAGRVALLHWAGILFSAGTMAGLVGLLVAARLYSQIALGAAAFAMGARPPSKEASFAAATLGLLQGLGALSLVAGGITTLIYIQSLTDRVTMGN